MEEAALMGYRLRMEHLKKHLNFMLFNSDFTPQAQQEQELPFRFFHVNQFVSSKQGAREAKEKETCSHFFKNHSSAKSKIKQRKDSIYPQPGPGFYKVNFSQVHKSQPKAILKSRKSLQKNRTDMRPFMSTVGPDWILDHGMFGFKYQRGRDQLRDQNNELKQSLTHNGEEVQLQKRIRRNKMSKKVRLQSLDEQEIKEGPLRLFRKYGILENMRKRRKQKFKSN